MYCPDKEKYNKNYDDLSESEVIELFDHAETCDFHNCLVSDYEASAMPYIDDYVKRNPYWRFKLARLLKGIREYLAESNPMNLLKQQVFANILLSFSIVILSATLLIGTVLNDNKTLGSELQLELSKLNKLALDIKPIEEKPVPVEEFPQPEQQIESYKSKIIELNKTVDKLKKEKEPSVSISGYELDKFQSSENNGFEEKEKPDKDLKIQKITESPKIRWYKERMPGERFVAIGLNPNSDKMPFKNEERIQRERFVAIGSNPNSDKMPFKNEGVLLVTATPITPIKVNSANADNGIVKIIFHLNEDDNQAKSIKAYFRFNNQLFQIIVVKNQNGIYIISVPKGSICQIKLDFENKTKIKEFLANENIDFEFQDKE